MAYRFISRRPSKVIEMIDFDIAKINIDRYNLTEVFIRIKDQ